VAAVTVARRGLREFVWLVQSRPGEGNTLSYRRVLLVAVVTMLATSPPAAFAESASDNAVQSVAGDMPGGGGDDKPDKPDKPDQPDKPCGGPYAKFDHTMMAGQKMTYIVWNSGKDAVDAIIDWDADKWPEPVPVKPNTSVTLYFQYANPGVYHPKIYVIGEDCVDHQDLGQIIVLPWV
jgi:hypothetical protein